MLSKFDLKDVSIDKWTSKIFRIINSGPSGGFVRYAIDSRNRLYVEKTGNRAQVEDVVNELLPNDSCRYIAYNFKFQKGSFSSTRLIWFLWTPPAAPAQEPIKYADGLASALIGLKAQSSIPILAGNSVKDLAIDSILRQI